MSPDQTPLLSNQTLTGERDALGRAIEESMLAGVAAVDEQGAQIYVNRAFCEMVGWDEAELLGAKPPFVYWPPEEHETLGQALARMMRGQAPPAGAELRFMRRDGSRFDVLVQAAPLRRGVPEVKGWVACVYDVSEQKQVELRLLTEHAVSRVLAEADTTAEALRRTLEAICETARWEWGALWTVDDGRNDLRCVETWHRPDTDVGEFELVSRGMRFQAGAGMPGRVWSSAKPMWVADIMLDDNFPRRGVARSAGLRSAMGFPVLVDGRVLAVMEFFSRNVRQPQQSLAHMMSSIGALVGHF